MSLTLTDEQRRAATRFEADVRVVGGAGTGKSRVLVERYAAILERGVADVGAIAVVAFSRPAAADLRDGIRNRLSSGGIGLDRLADLAGAPILTLDALCERIVREGAAIAGVDPGFRRIGSLESDFFREGEVRDGLVDRLDRGAGSALRLLECFGFEGVVDLLRTLGACRGTLAPWLDHLAGLSADPPESFDRPTWLRLRRDAALAEDEIRACRRALEELRPPGDEDTETRSVDRALRCLDALEAAEDPERLLRIVREIRSIDAAGTPHEGALLRLRRAFKSVARDVEPAAADRESESEARLRDLAVECLAVEAARSGRRQRSGALDRLDIRLAARALLRDHPEIRTVWKERYRVFLVDDCHEADRLESEILSHLLRAEGPNPRCGNLVTEAARPAPGRLAREDVQIPDRGKGGVAAGLLFGAEVHRLTRGFRNAPVIAAFAEEWSRRTPAARDLEREGPPLPPIPFSGEERVELRIWRGTASDDGAVCRAGEADMLAGIVREIVSASSRSFRDVVLLLRTMAHAGSYETALRRASVPCVPVPDTPFFALPEIRDLMTVLTALEDPDDEIALASLLRSSRFGVSDDTITRLCLGDGLRRGLDRRARIGAIPQEEVCRLDEAASFLAEGARLRGAVPVPERIDWILDRTGPPRDGSDSRGASSTRRNLERLRRIVRQIEARGALEAGEFLRGAARAAARRIDVREPPGYRGDADAVRILTIRQARGRGFPVVLVPEVGRPGVFGPRRLAWHPDFGIALRDLGAERPGEKPWRYRALSFLRGREALEAHDRLLHAAATRARERLVLTAGVAGRFEWSRVRDSWLGRFWGLIPETLRDGEGPASASTRLQSLCRATVIEAAEAATRGRGHARDPFIEPERGLDKTTPRE